MSENHSFVSPDKLSRPERIDLSLAANRRLYDEINGVRHALMSLQREFGVAPMQVAPVQQQTYQQAPQTYSQPAPAPAPAPTAPQNQPQSYGEGTSMDAYLSALEAPEAQNEMADLARQQIWDAHDGKDNYDLAA